MDGFRYLSGVPLFVGLDPEALARLAAHTRLVSYSAGDTIVEMDTGTPLFVVIEGQVRIVDPAVTDDLAPILLGPGECFGDRALLNGEPRRVSIEASEDVRLLMLEQKAFRELVARIPVGLPPRSRVIWSVIKAWLVVEVWIGMRAEEHGSCAWLKDSHIRRVSASLARLGAARPADRWSTRALRVFVEWSAPRCGGTDPLVEPSAARTVIALLTAPPHHLQRPRDLPASVL